MKIYFFILLFFVEMTMFAQKSEFHFLNATENGITISIATRNLLSSNINYCTIGSYSIPRGVSKFLINNTYTEIGIYLDGAPLYYFDKTSKIYKKLPSISLYRSNYAFKFCNAEKLDKFFSISNLEIGGDVGDWDKDKLQLYNWSIIPRTYLTTSEYIYLGTFYLLSASGIGSYNKVVISYIDGKYIVETF